MSPYYLHIDGPDPEFYSKEILTKIVPSYTFTGITRIGMSVGICWEIPNANILIKDISRYFTSRYKFPKIIVFTLFKHHEPQSIHIDSEEFRQVGVNLPLVNYLPTKMVWYGIKILYPAIPFRLFVILKLNIMLLIQ